MLAQIFGSTVNSAFNSTYLMRPYTILVDESELTVNAAAQVNVVTVLAGFNYIAFLSNRSAGGQLIRIGNAPTFAPNVGLLLNVNDTFVIENFTVSLNARANLAGGLLSRLIMRTA